MKRLFVIGGQFSYLNALSSGPILPGDDITLLVLFTYDQQNERRVRRELNAVHPANNIRFLYEPSDYNRLLGDRKWMQDLCDDPAEVRMFFTHNTWLHNRVFSAYPDASIVLYEEGMASYYPGLIDRYDAFDRIDHISLHNYLGRFHSLDALRYPDLYRSIDPETFVNYLGRLPTPSDADRLADDMVVLTEQYLFKKGDAFDISTLADEFAVAIADIVDAGFRVGYKKHPRDSTDLWSYVWARLDDRHRGAVEVLGGEFLLERALMEHRPAAVAGVSSTSLLSSPHLFDVPSFRVPSSGPLTIAEPIAPEREGIVFNHLAVLGRLPSTELFSDPTAIQRPDLRFSEHVAGAPSVLDDPMLAAFLGVRFGPDFVRLLRDVSHPDVDLVSFDLFDTLVDRPALEPRDLHYLLDRSAASDLAPYLRYSNARLKVFSRLDTESARTGGRPNEYTLDDVERVLASDLAVSADVARSLRRAEVDLESRLIAARPSGTILALTARTANKQVAVVTDTYFDDDELEQVALRHLPFRADLILSSAVEQLRKADDGELFGRLVDRSGVPGSRILHIGDNRIGDVNNATKRGLQARHVPSAADVFRSSPGLGGIWKGVRIERGMSLLLGLVARRLCPAPGALVSPASRSGGTGFSLGYSMVGPALFSWSRWLLDQAAERSNDSLHFVARDGWIPYEICQRLQAVDPARSTPELRYLFGSRSAYLSVFGDDPGHVSYTEFVHGLSPQNTVRNTLVRRFGVSTAEMVASRFEAAGFGLDEEIGGPRASLFVDVLRQCSDSIALANAERAETAREYYRSELKGFERPAVVDFGYSGSSQRGVGYSLGHNVDGYFFVTMEHATEYAAITGATTVPYSDDNAFFANGAFIEYLITDPSLQECLGFERLGDRIVPTLGPQEPFDPLRHEIHRGVREFLDDLFSTFGADTWQLTARPAIGHRALSWLVSRPDRTDALLFAGRRHEDTIGSNRGDVLRYWEPGRTALEAS
ncbi:MAG: hypothetical protein CL424_18895 [Acidimicrobiaceae bacterium]|nr:hypothetical protein [Acidimicrobiaceae bacterium]